MIMVLSFLVGALFSLLIFLLLKLVSKKVRKEKQRKEYHQLIQKKMNILAELSERAPAPLSPRLLDNVFKQNFGRGETENEK